MAWFLESIASDGSRVTQPIRNLPFLPDQIDADAAGHFFGDLKTRFALARNSRYAQPFVVTPVPQGCVVVFLQGPVPVRRKQAHMSCLDMLRTVATGAQGRPVLVKPHPQLAERGQAQIDTVRAEGHALIPTAANVHDLLSAASVSVSFNSATALEGFLHGTPAILFGRSDFHHALETVRKPAAFALALDRAMARKQDYAKFLYWYFGQHCLNLHAPDFADNVLKIFAKAGFDATRLGFER